jgi:hypothetical protein
MWDVNLQTLDIMWKDGSWCNDIVISDSIPNICVQGEIPLCTLPSDGSTTNKENMRSVICVSTSIHLMYVRIPGKGITVFFTSMHLVYVRIPSKRINVQRVAYILCMLGSRVRGSPCFLLAYILVFVRISGKRIILYQLRIPDKEISIC